MENKIYYDVAQTLTTFLFKDPTAVEGKPSYTGKYPLSNARRVIEATKNVADPTHGKLPYIMVANAIAETNLGQRNYENMQHAIPDQAVWNKKTQKRENRIVHPDLLNQLEPYLKQTPENKEKRAGIFDKWSSHHMSDLLSHIKGLERALQSWQGMGKVGQSTEPYFYRDKPGKWFGQSYNMDMSKTLAHGKRVHAFEKELEKNPTIRGMVEEVAQRRKREESY